MPLPLNFILENEHELAELELDYNERLEKLQTTQESMWLLGTVPNFSLEHNFFFGGLHLRLWRPSAAPSGWILLHGWRRTNTRREAFRTGGRTSCAYQSTQALATSRHPAGQRNDQVSPSIPGKKGQDQIGARNCPPQSWDASGACRTLCMSCRGRT